MNIVFKQIKFRNLLSFGNNDNILKFNKGINLIVGKNGNGKSACTDAICFCLYGKPYRSIKIQELINNKNKHKLFVEIHFSKNNDEYVIRRGLKPDLIEIIKNDKELDLQSHKSLIQDEIDSIIGVNYSLFKQIISLSSLYNIPFLDLPQADKRDMVESIFNIKIFSKMLKEVKKKQTVLLNDIEIKDKELLFLKQSFEEVKKQLEDSEKSKIEFEKKKKQIIEESLNEINKLKIDREEILKNQNKLELLIKELEQNIKSNETKPSDLLEQLIKNDNKIKEIDNLLKELESSVKDVIMKFNPKFDSVSELDGQINNLTRFKMEIEQDYAKELNEHKLKINNELNIKNKEKEILLLNKTKITNTNIINSDEECLGLKDDLSIIKNLLNIFNKDKNQLLNNKESNCSLCKQKITEEHKQSELSKINQEIKTCEKNIEISSTNLDKLVNEKKEKLLSEIDDKINSIDVSIKEINEILEGTTNALLTKKIENLDKNDEEIFKLTEKKTETFEKIKSEIKKELDLKLEIVLEENEIVKKSIENNTELENKNKELEKSFNETKTNISLNNERINSSNKLIKTFEEKIKEENERNFSVNIDLIKENFEEKKNLGKKLVEEIKNKKELNRIYDITKNILEDAGIKKFFFSKLIPKLNNSINYYLDLFELPVRFSFDDLFDYKIIETGNKERSFKSFSAGEQTRLNLSILLSFIELNKAINSTNTDVLFMDEFLDSGLDSEGIEIILEKLKEISNKDNMKVYLISHKDVHNSMNIDNIMKINKENGFSKICKE